MTIIVKLLIGLVIAAISATIVSVTQSGAPFDPLLLIAFSAATLAAVLLGSAGGAQASSQDSKPRKQKKEKRTEQSSGDREFGKVKWFNVSKGFGFIIRDNGEEIFVHFRSIQGQGRRGLRDGQSVSFIVVENDKGPQAEDVTPEAD
jgi:CspA family cold shock protein